MANKIKLIQLAEHLLNGKLGHEKFNFDTFNSFDCGKRPEDKDIGTENVCGTSGCAIGECPVLWPIEWKFSKVGVSLFGTPVAGRPVLIDCEKYEEGTMDSACTFFDIDYKVYDYLFLPKAPGRPNSLKSNATKEEVAGRIIDWCKNDLQHLSQV